MKNFNLTEWALHHKQLVYYFLVVIFIAGIFSYRNLGRMEDPDFTIRQMVVSVNWPGASARQVEEQVTDKIEKKLQDTPGLDYLRSYSTPGQSVIYVVLKDDAVKGDQIRPIWLEVRNMVNDIKPALPQGVDGPYYNDRFDDVFGCIYALTGDGYSYEELRERAEKIRRILVDVSGVRKVDVIGVQTEKIYIELENAKLAQLGLVPSDMMNVVKAQNAMAPSGMLETAADNVYLRVSGMFENLDDVKNLPVRAGGHNLRLGDVARITRGYSDPPDPRMFYNGQPAIGLALSMDKGGNILDLGTNLDRTLTQIKQQLPLGLELNTVADQPDMVQQSINDFIRSLAEAVAIVLIVCFLSLGARSGIVVALCIPLVITGVFVVMKVGGIDLHKISLGALILSLGLLVDDAIIAIEIMTVRLQQGWNRFDAACYAYEATSFPMLTGTLITCAGFIPIGFSQGTASEFVGSIFSVITIALLISWGVSVLVTPLLGYSLVTSSTAGSVPGKELYNTRFYCLFKQLLTWCLVQRKKVLFLTVICFIGSAFLMGQVKQEFFPESSRPELIVDMRLPQGASLQATEQEAARFVQRLTAEAGLVNYSYYVGKGAPRFVLTAEAVYPNTNFAQFIFVAKDVDFRDKLAKQAKNLLDTEFPQVRGNIKFIKTGPSYPYSVMLRVTGHDHDKVREIAGQVLDQLAINPMITEANLDWNEKSKVLRLDIDQDKVRILGIESQTLAANLQSLLSGSAIAEFRERDKTIGIVFRLDSASRCDLSLVKDLNIHTGGGQFVPLDQIAKISYEAEEGLIWRRNLKPTITVQANTVEGILGNNATKAVYKDLEDLRSSLPPGYSIDIGGSLESSLKASGWILQPVPLMIVAIVTLLMLQLHSIPKMLLTLLTAPLGLIGVSVSLFLTGRPMGFVVQLSILALSGIIMRNSVILIDQIEQHLKAGETVWESIINAAVTRFRPIMLTAAAAILGMVPLMSNVFWGPMAVAIAGGLFGATILTLLVLPAMYATWYRAQPEGLKLSQAEQAETGSLLQ
ncbi:efflux RND transporter permease subunit [Sporomusa sp. KB1]|jgi:multidrug efflux pump subunit AcrB|uniref:efflux RND transporter permease subunit n=1 Tax=Sporomusa sp. KB1 TaxID=943346 RepID=UPI0011A2252F|nr:efflux RND transporter permease subunit [Sporomusa sp. KB1]TWH46118.1 multidrug efflux pump subunit AcrB [Sporomusa sp. KB1]